MRERRLERGFERFRRSGDVEALGAVFDGAAPELLRVAASLSSRLAEAEDLVQATFLTAIERAPKWDRRERLMPWLLGILVRHAHEARRRKRREQDAAGEEPGAERAATAGLEREELARELEAALAKLPAGEREVLRPFLLEGRAPVEIARDAKLAPGAVRMRIHRGLGRLRRALPAGLGLGAAVELGAGRGFAAMRAELLARAAASPVALGAPLAGVAPSAWILGGGLVLKNSILAGMLAALVLALGWLAWPEGASPGGASVGGLVAGEPATARADASAQVERMEPEAAAPAEAPARVAAAPAEVAADEGLLERSLAGVRARLLTHERAPVADVEVALLELRPDVLTGAWEALQAGEAAALRLELDRARTDPAGQFTLRGARTSGLHALGIDLGGPRATLVFLDQALKTAEISELGEVVLEPAGRVVGTIVDRSGRPVVGALVRAAALPEWVEPMGLHGLRPGAAMVSPRPGSDALEVVELPAWLDRWHERLPIPTARTDERGRFALEAVGAGEASLIVSAPGRPALVRRGLDVPAGGVCDAGVTTALDGLTWMGQVTDEAGAPLAGVELRAASVAAWPAPMALLSPAVTSDAEGRFALAGLMPGQPALLAARRAPGLAWETRGPADPAQDARLVLADGATLELELRSTDGAPVAGAAVALAPSGPMSGPRVPASLSSLRLVGALERPEPGLVRLTGVTPGEYRARVAAPGFADAWVELQVDSGRNRERVELSPARALEVRVVDADSGSAVAGCAVSVHSGRRAPALEGARSGADGAARFERVPAGAGPALELRAEHPAYALQRAALDPADERVELRLTRGGALEVWIHRGGFAPDPPVLVELDASDGDWTFLGATDARGRVLIERLPPGDYSWFVRERVRGEGAFDLIESFGGELAQLSEGSVKIVAGQRARIEVGLDGAHEPARARVVGRVTLDGAPVRDVELTLLVDDPSSADMEREHSARPDGDGEYEIEDVPPGSYTLLAHDPGSGAALLGARFQHLVPLELGPGETRVVELDWTRHEVEVELSGPGGRAPIPDARVALKPQGAGERRSFAYGTTGADGRARVLVHRAGDYVVLAQSEQGTARAELRVDGASTRVRLELARGVACAGVVELPPEVALEAPPTLVLTPSAGGIAQVVVPERRDGRLVFRAVGLPAGECSAQLVGPQPGFQALRFELPPSGDEALVLRFERR